MTLDLTAETLINYAACAYRDYRAGILTRDAAILIVMNSLKLADDHAGNAVDARPYSDALAEVLCHRHLTDDFPCADCGADAAYMSAATNA